jgi:phosphoglycolate phosphatase
VANVIFDFDGTLADTLGLTIHIFENLVHGGKPLSPEEIERLRGMSMIHIGAELKILPWKVPFLLARGRAKMRRRMRDVQVFAGMPEVVKQLHADGHALYILSSNSTQNIRPFLKRNGMNTEFLKVYGGSSVFGKTRVLRRALKRDQLNRGDTYYVGDEVRDIEASHHVGISVISVPWGYNNERILREHEPDFLVSKPADIRKIITG